MAKKMLYAGEAERLYVIEQCTFAEIASRLKLSEKTVRMWKDEGQWDVRRREYLRSKESFHEELYEFSRKLLKSIRDDMEAGEKVDSGRLYTLGRMIPLLAKTKDYEEAQAKSGNDAPKQEIDKEIIDKIKKEVLGLE